MKTLDKRGVRRMLVTTLGRIERIQDAIRTYSEDRSNRYTTSADRARNVKRCKDELAKERAKLRHYNQLATQLLQGK